MNAHNSFVRRFLASAILVMSALVVGCNDDGQIQNPAKNLSHWSNEIRVKAIQDLADVKDPSAIQSVVAGLEDKDPRVRRTSVRVLARMNTSKSLEALREALKHQDAHVRCEAAWALWERTDDPKLLVALLSHLQGP